MAIETLRPNADGTYQDFSPKGGGAHYVEVDEVTPDDFATYVSKWVGAAWDDEETFGLPNHSEGSGTINQVKVYVRAARDPANTALMKVAVYTHGTLYVGDAENLGTLFAPISYQWNTNPYTGSPWTWDEVDALEIGFQTGNGNVTAYATQVYVEIEYEN